VNADRHKVAATVLRVFGRETDKEIEWLRRVSEANDFKVGLYRRALEAADAILQLAAEPAVNAEVSGWRPDNKKQIGHIETCGRTNPIEVWRGYGVVAPGWRTTNGDPRHIAKTAADYGVIIARHEIEEVPFDMAIFIGDTNICGMSYDEALATILTASGEEGHFDLNFDISNRGREP
jgi:hypothetical protein